MKEQRLITGSDRHDWTNAVNRFLEAGWNVVPGTLVIAVTSCVEMNGSQSYTREKVSSAFSVVIERE